jgi:hypothetical protein
VHALTHLGIEGGVFGVAAWHDCRESRACRRVEGGEQRDVDATLDESLGE